MKTYNAEFVKGAVSVIDFPEPDIPEIAFAGRSNVGKSSLINTIVNRKNLARTSSTPGKTREINFFNIEGKWMLVDMPGFGYAAVGKAFSEKWTKLNFEYLEKRKDLVLACSLVDSRHDPTAVDLSLIEWLENHKREFMVILTKCDKISDKLKAERIEQVSNLVKLCKYCTETLPFSSVTGEGRKELQAIIQRIASA